VRYSLEVQVYDWIIIPLVVDAGNDMKLLTTQFLTTPAIDDHWFSVWRECSSPSVDGVWEWCVTKEMGPVNRITTESYLKVALIAEGTEGF
jgi:hypothetical protein